MVPGSELSEFCLFCLLLCAMLPVESGGRSSGVKENFNVPGQTSGSIIAIAGGLWLVVA